MLLNGAIEPEVELTFTEEALTAIAQRAIERPDLAADPGYLRNAGRVEHRTRLVEELSATFRRHCS